MPQLNDATLEQHKSAASPYGFSATRIKNLGSTEYTLVTIVVDVSGSVQAFLPGLTKTVIEIFRACKISPRADSLMIRLVQFSTGLDEIHGYKLLSRCNEADYEKVLRIGGSTHLFDVLTNTLGATVDYARELRKSKFLANAIVIVVTDGEDYGSTLTLNSVKLAHDEAVATEALESMVSILVGVNVTNARIATFLQNLEATVGFTQYEELNNADAATLAKLANFVSNSISAQSQALGTGGPSQPITF